jgi:hypothetical protein
MRKIIFPAFLIVLIACDSTNEKDAKERKSKQEEVFPVAYFFQEQIRMVDSLKLPTVKIIVSGGQTLTEAISMEEFKFLALEFINSDISGPSLKNAYEESSFADQSIPSVTITYSTDDTTLPVRRLDVIIDPDPVRNDQVKSVYIEKLVKHSDTTVVKKLYWKANENFQVITSNNIPGSKPVVSQLKVSWNGMN